MNEKKIFYAMISNGRDAAWGTCRVKNNSFYYFENENNLAEFLEPRKEQL